MANEYEEVAEAAAIRKDQIRTWAAKQIGKEDFVVLVADSYDEEDEQIIDVPQEPEPEVVEEEVLTVTPEVQEELTVEKEEPVAPSKAANKGEWVAFRMETHSLTEDDANERTKEELINLDG